MKRSLVCFIAIAISLLSCTKNNGSTSPNISANKFIGNWRQAQNPSATNAGQFPISIVNTTVRTSVEIKNFNNDLLVVNANVINSDSLFIPSQIISGKNISGSCKYTGNRNVNVQYQITDLTSNTSIVVNTIWD